MAAAVFRTRALNSILVPHRSAHVHGYINHHTLCGRHPSSASLAPLHLSLCLHHCIAPFAGDTPFSKAPILLADLSPSRATKTAPRESYARGCESIPSGSRRTHSVTVESVVERARIHDAALSTCQRSPSQKWAPRSGNAS